MSSTETPLDVDFAAGTFTSRRIERIVQIAAGVGSLAVGAQSFIAALGGTDAPQWHVSFVVVIFGTLAAMLLSCFTGKGLRVTATVFAVVFPLMLVAWPMVAENSPDPTGAQPWIWYVTNIATLAAVLVFPLALQVVWTIGLPVLYFAARMMQVNFAPGFLVPNLFDLSFGLCLGAILLLTVKIVRSIGRTVDDARGVALAQYTAAASAEAAESERISMAALMHDSVMGALIAAARATTDRERALTAVMAQEALTGLADAESDERVALGRPVGAVTVARDLRASAKNLGVDVAITPPDDVEVPGHVARALTLAATQAIANAIEHAEAVGLSVEVIAAPHSCTVHVRDEGGGLDLAAIPDDRLGIRASILARMAAVGGTATISSERGCTVVTMGWRR